MVNVENLDPLAGLVVDISYGKTTSSNGVKIRPVWNELTLTFTMGPMVLIREVWPTAPNTPEDAVSLIMGGASATCCTSPQQAIGCEVCFGELPPQMFHGWEEMTRELLIPYFSRLGPIQGEFAVAWVLEFTETLAAMDSGAWASLPKRMVLADG